jgi:drug/metabolite transporter (DMT)-like permease
MPTGSARRRCWCGATASRWCRWPRHDLWAALRGGAWRITLVGATLGAGQTLCFWESLHTLDTSVAILLFYTYPALTLGLDRLLFKRRIRLRALLCVAAILIGAGLVTLPGLASGRLDPRGLMWLLPSPVFYAFYLAANAVLMRRHPPVICAGFLYLGLAIVFLAAGSVIGIEVPETATAWLLIVFIALGPGALTVTLFSYSVPRLGASSYAIIANTELLTVVAIGVLWLGDAVSPARAVGGALIAAGILTHALARQPAPVSAPTLPRLRRGPLPPPQAGEGYQAGVTLPPPSLAGEGRGGGC